MSGRCHFVHLGNLFVEGAAGKHGPEDTALERAGLPLKPVRAAILALVVAPDAVVRLIEGTREIGALIGQRKAVARPAMLRPEFQHVHACIQFDLNRNKMMRVDFVRRPEEHAAFVKLLSLRRMHGPRGVARGNLKFFDVLRLGCHPGVNRLREAQLVEFSPKQSFEFVAERRCIEARHVRGAVFLRGAPLHKQAFYAVERRHRLLPVRERAQRAVDPNSSPRKSSTSGASVTIKSE